MTEIRRQRGQEAEPGPIIRRVHTLIDRLNRVDNRYAAFVRMRTFRTPRTRRPPEDECAMRPRHHHCPC